MHFTFHHESDSRIYFPYQTFTFQEALEFKMCFASKNRDIEGTEYKEEFNIYIKKGVSSLKLCSVLYSARKLNSLSHSFLNPRPTIVL